jgi:hypothetical protein
MPCDPLPPPADTPKPRPPVEWVVDDESLRMLVAVGTHCSNACYNLIGGEYGTLDGLTDADRERIRETAEEWHRRFAELVRARKRADPLPWQPAALPEGHAELLIEAANFLEHCHISLPANMPHFASECKFLAARLRAAAGGDKG